MVGVVTVVTMVLMETMVAVMTVVTSVIMMIMVAVVTVVTTVIMGTLVAVVIVVTTVNNGGNGCARDDSGNGYYTGAVVAAVDSDNGYDWGNGFASNNNSDSGSNMQGQWLGYIVTTVILGTRVAIVTLVTTVRMGTVETVRVQCNCSGYSGSGVGNRFTLQTDHI